MFKHPTGTAPKKVIILGMGPTRQDYLNILASDTPDGIQADEVWGVNHVSQFAKVDVSFIMDDYAGVVGHIPSIQKIYETADHPIITSVARKGCPSAVDFPLGEVLTMNPKRSFLNHTGAYMLAYAAWLGVEEVVIFGLDYVSQEQTYVASNLLAGMPPRYLGCAGYWAGFCEARGMNIVVTPNSPLLDADYRDNERLYGYLVKPIINREGDAPADHAKPHLVTEEDKDHAHG